MRLVDIDSDTEEDGKVDLQRRVSAANLASLTTTEHGAVASALGSALGVGNDLAVGAKFLTTVAVTIECVSLKKSLLTVSVTHVLKTPIILEGQLAAQRSGVMLLLVATFLNPAKPLEEEAHPRGLKGPALVGTAPATAAGAPVAAAAAAETEGTGGAMVVAGAAAAAGTGAASRARATLPRPAAARRGVKRILLTI